MKYVMAAVMALGAGQAMAAAKLAGLSAKQASPLDALVVVTIERPSPLDMMCEATVDLGDGTTRNVSFGVGDKHSKTFQHKYAKPGTYKLTVKATSKCDGMREATFTAESGTAAKTAAAPKVKASCPSGWSLVPDSFQGYKYTCRANPPSRPIKCEGGTKYFAENGAIGCR